MEITDYNQKLSQARERYNEAVDEVRDSYKQQEKDLERLHRTREKRQAENYQDSKLQMERDLKENERLFDKKTQEELRKRQEEFRRKLGEQREGFEMDRNDVKTRYDRRLQNISDAFEKARKEDDRLAKERLANLDENYDDRYQRNLEDFQNDLNTIKRKTNTKLHESQAMMNSDKNDIIHRSNDEKLALIQDAANNRNKTENKNQMEMEALRDSQSREIASLRDHNESVKKDILQAKNNENESLKEDFQNLTDGIIQRNEDQQKSLSRQNREEMITQKRQFQNDLDALRRRSDELVMGGDALEQAERKHARKEKSYESRINNIKNKLEEYRYKDQLDRERLDAAHRATNKEESLKFAKALDEKGTAVRDFQQKVSGKLKEENEKTTEAYKSQLAKVELDAEQNAISGRQESNEKLRRQRIEFGRTVNILNDANRQASDKLRDEYAKEKTEYIQEQRVERFNEREDLKDHLNETFARKSDSYEKRISNKERDIQRVTEIYENKLDQIKKKSAKELEVREKLEHQRRIEDRRSFVREKELMERDKQKEINILRQEYDKRISSIKHNEETRINKLTERYENQLLRLNNDLRSEMKIKLEEAKANYDRLYMASEIEREAMKQQYETRLEKTRQANVREAERQARVQIKPPESSEA